MTSCVKIGNLSLNHNNEFTCVAFVAVLIKGIDVMCLPQFSVRFKDTGEVYSAYPEEVPEIYWTDEMKVFLLAQQEFVRSAQQGIEPVNPFISNKRLSFVWSQGLLVMDAKTSGSDLSTEPLVNFSFSASTVLSNYTDRLAVTVAVLQSQIDQQLNGIDQLITLLSSRYSDAEHPRIVMLKDHAAHLRETFSHMDPSDIQRPLSATDVPSAIFIQEIDFMDPASALPVQIAIYKDPHSNGLFGVDSSFITDNENGDLSIVTTPFNGNLVNL